MNDEMDAATTQILNGPPGSEIGTVGFGRPDDGDGDRMWIGPHRKPLSSRPHAKVDVGSRVRCHVCTRTHR